MGMPFKKTKKTSTDKLTPVAKDTVKDFQDIFEFIDEKLISKGELTIDDIKYKKGDEIIVTKFGTLNLLDNPEKYRYSINRRRLIGRIPKIIR